MPWYAICQSMVKNNTFQIELDHKDSLSDFFLKKQNYRFSVWISSGRAWEWLFLSQAPRWYVLYWAKAYFPNLVGDENPLKYLLIICIVQITRSHLLSID